MTALKSTHDKLHGGGQTASKKIFQSISKFNRLIVDVVGVTAEALPSNIDWKLAFLNGDGSVSAKFSHRMGRFPPTIFRTVT